MRTASRPFPLPQIVASVGILVAISYITPPTIQPRDVYEPFGAMFALTALSALVRTLFVQRRSGFAPVPVEQVPEKEFARDPAHGD